MTILDPRAWATAFKSVAITVCLPTAVLLSVACGQQAPPSATVVPQAQATTPAATSQPQATQAPAQTQVTAPATTSQQATIQFVGAEPPETFSAAIDAFQKKYPDIKVTYNSVPFADLNNVLQSRLGGKDASLDVFMADEPRVPTLANSGFLTDLSGEKSKLDAAVSPQAVEAVSWNGKIWSFPISTSTAVLFYNRKLLSAANATPPGSNPSDRWTWQQTIDAATKAQQAGAKWGFSFQQVDRYYQLQVLPESLGAGSGLEGPDLLTPRITNDGWVQAMNWYGSTFAGGVSPRGIAVGQIPDLFANGELAFMVGNPIYIQRFSQTQGLDFGVSPQPYFADGKAVTPTDGWSLGISPFSAHKDAAMKFIEFLALDPEGTTAWSTGRSLTPANTAAFDTWRAGLAQRGGTMTQGIDALIVNELNSTAVHRPRTIGYVTFEEIMNRCFADIRNGAAAQERLDQASSELTSAFARLKSQ